MEGAQPVFSDSCGRFYQSDRFFCVGRRERRRSCLWLLMELSFELSFGLIADQTYWWWCECMGEYIGNHLGVLVGLVGEPDAIAGRVVQSLPRRPLSALLGHSWWCQVIFSFMDYYQMTNILNHLYEGLKLPLPLLSSTCRFAHCHHCYGSFDVRDLLTWIVPSKPVQWSYVVGCSVHSTVLTC